MSSDQDNQKGVNLKRIFWRGVLAIFVVLLVAWAGFRWYAHNRLATEIERVQAAGHPLSAQELEDWLPAVEGRNAADVYQLAFDAYEADEELESKLPVFSAASVNWRHWDTADGAEADAMRHAAKQLLEKNQVALMHLAEAAKIPDCRWPADLHSHIVVDAPHLNPLLWGCRLLGMQAQLHADANDTDAFVTTIDTMVAAAESLNYEPTVISSLTRTAIYSLTLEALARGVNQISLTNQQLAHLQIQMKNAQSWSPAMYALIGERALGYGAIHNFNMVAGFDFLGIIDIDHSEFLRLMTNGVEIARDGRYVGNPHAGEIDEVPRLCFATLILVPAMDAWFVTNTQSESALKAAETGLALQRYRNDHGQWPEELTALVPEYIEQVPEDQFAQAPLRYRVEPDGIIVYGLNRDAEDNHGRQWDKYGSRYERGTDITFTLGPVQERLFPITDFDEEDFYDAPPVADPIAE